MVSRQKAEFDVLDLALADYPATIDDLKLAPKAKPILDKYIPNGGVPEFNIGWYQLSTETSQLLDIPDDIKNKSGRQIYNFGTHCGYKSKYRLIIRGLQ